jgi:hypothetical protein
MSKKAENVTKEHRRTLYWRILLVVAAVWAVFFVLSFIKSFDDWYVNHIHPVLHGVVARVFDVFPFAVGEIVMYLTFVFAVVTVILSIVYGVRWLERKVRKKERKKSAFYRNYMKVFLAVFALCLWTYLFHWWIPYNGHVVGEEPKRRGYTAEEYRYVRNLVGARFRAAQEALPRDADGRIIYPDKKTAYEQVVRALKNLSDRYPRLKGFYGQPKAAKCSDVLDWMYIGGYTYPYTMEITYNKYVDNLYWYTLIAHEAAHSKGFYKENEGEFMGDLSCILSDDPITVYSGCDDIYYALESAMCNALVSEFGLEEGTRLYSEYQAEDAEFMPDFEQVYLDETDAFRAAKEAYAADDHPLEQYADTASEVADTGWDVQEKVSQENYYDDGTRLIMDYFIGLREKAAEGGK